MTSMISLRGIPRLGVGFLVTLLCSLAGYALAKLPGFRSSSSPYCTSATKPPSRSR